jgi:LPS O-antigen subunit length determinant protein (WzzB/FepE family)
MGRWRFLKLDDDISAIKVIRTLWASLWYIIAIAAVVLLASLELQNLL